MRNPLAIGMAFLLGGLAIAQTATVPPATPPTPPLTPENTLYLDLSTGGKVAIQLRPDIAPANVAQLKTLARRGFYNGLAFHRVIDGFMAQGGDPKGTGEGGSDLPDLKAEFSGLPHVRGVVSMARAASENSANSQFFIMFAPRMALDGKYTVVGRVIGGMNYVDAIQRGEGENGAVTENASTIVKASIAGDAPGLPQAATTAPAPASSVPTPTAKDSTPEVSAPR